MDKKTLPMRPGVGVILLNNKNQVFVGKRKDNPGNKWQMPQGGIDEGENYVAARKCRLLLFKLCVPKYFEFVKMLDLA